ncbi:MAG TPA: DUF922 domain-containing protein [Candidatus Dormibacteraeota bacterium]|nr:DUF922 domain-containing protein [Candidatus Dormibacteraeota bacterium]
MTHRFARSPIIVLLAIALTAGGCAVDQATLSPPTPGLLPSPESVVVAPTPRPSASPCAKPLRDIGQSSQLIADQLASLRPLLVARTYDGWAVLGQVRRVNETLLIYGELTAELDACPNANKLAARVATVKESARAGVTVVLDYGAAVALVPRDAAVGLFRLLPEVLAISKDAAELARGLALEIPVAEVQQGSDEPIAKLPSLPTPAPTARPADPLAVLRIRASFFGSRVTLSTYGVSGTTPTEIWESMNRNGPYSAWLHGNASGLTQASAEYRFHLASNTDGSCYIWADANPPILLTYTVDLPRWSAPSGVAATTITYWNQTLQEIATHEKHHVTIYRAAQTTLNATLASSTCGNYDANLTAVWNDVNRQQCEFDMKEYGADLGLSLESCVNQ